MRGTDETTQTLVASPDTDWPIGAKVGIVNISDGGLRFIISNEGTVTENGRHVMYNDDGRPSATSRGNATIGYGHKVHDGPIDGDPSEAPFVNGLSDDEAFALLRADIPKYEAVVDMLAAWELNQNQYDAMCDFTYNTGGHYPAVWALVNAGADPRPVLEVTAILPAAATAGLKRRRTAEADLYNTPVEEQEDMRPFLVWATDTSKLYLVGPWGSSWVTNADDATTLKGLYGEPTVVLHESTMRSLGTRIVVGA